MAIVQFLRSATARLAGRRDTDDAIWLGRFAADRDEAAFAVLVDRHGPMVAGVCRRMLGHHHDAEDATQAVFVVLARNAAKVRQRENLSAWLHGVAVRVCRKALARRARLPRSADPVPEPAAEPTWSYGVRLIDEALAAVPERLRAPLVLCYLHGLTRDQAAGRLGLTETTFRGRLDRGKERLRRELLRRGCPLAVGLVVSAVGTTKLTAAEATAISAMTTGVVPELVHELTSGVFPTMSMTKRLAIGSVAVLGLLGVVVGVTLVLPSPAVGADPFDQLAKPDPKAGKADKKLDGVWVASVQSADGKYRRDYRLKFLDDRHLLIQLTVKLDFSITPQVITLKMKYELTRDLELKQEVLEKYTGEDKLNLSENDKQPRVWKLVWEKDGKAFAANMSPADPQSKPLRFVRDDQPPAKAAADPLVPESLTKIDRTIAKLPKFESEKPGYLLLAFGPAAKEKVWMVFDGANLYVDKNGNGDLTEDGEKVPAIPGFSRPPKSYLYTVSDVGEKKYTLQVSTVTVGPETVAPLIAVGHVGKLLQKVGPTDIRFKDEPEEARVVHFGSTLLVARPSLTMPSPLNATKADDWRVQVGTPGVGSGSFASFANEGLSKDVAPVADFVFEPKTPGGKPITRSVTLTERCCGDQFFAKVEVPAEADGSRAKVTLSFPKCPLGAVQPQTYEVPVVREK